MKTLYKFATLSLIVLFSNLPAQAALPKPVWQSGRVVLWDQTVWEGELSYNWLMETVLFRESDGRVRTFTPNQVCQFGWFDFSQHKQRQFRAFPDSTVKDQSRQAFFEVCMDGSLVVVRRLRQRQGLIKHKFGHPANFNDQPIMAQNTDYFDYFVYDAGRLRAFDRFYADIYVPLMTTYDKQLQQYVNVHQLNDRTLLGRLVLVDQYNLLSQRSAGTILARGSAPISSDE